MNPSTPQHLLRLGFKGRVRKFLNGHRSRRLKSNRKSLVGFIKKAVPARKPNNIRELETFAYEVGAKIPFERCQKLVAGYTSRLQYVIAAQGCSTKY